MFGNKEKPAGAENSVPVTSKSVSSKDVLTLIGEGCKVEGNFFIPTATRIDGTIKGGLTGDSGVIIGNKGRIEGNIAASEAVIYGTVVGNIDTHRLELKRGSVVNGDITVTILITEQGCNFNGKCNMKPAEPNTNGELKADQEF